MSENIALERKFQSKFARKVKKVKERAKSAGNVQNIATKPTKPKHGVVYVGHIPHGFYENEMLAYFKQFGKISNLRLCRSKATGQSKGYAFVEFADAEVAKIAAETMDNYLMFSRRLVAKYIPVEKPLQRMYKGASWSKQSYPLKVARQKVTKIRNKNIDEATHLKKSKLMISTINKNLRKLHALGINYSFQAVDDHNNLNNNFVTLNPSNEQHEDKDDSSEMKYSTVKKNALKGIVKKKNVTTKK